MPNLELIEKILEVTGESDETIQKARVRIMATVSYMFSTYFILYVEERTTDDNELEKFRQLVENVDKDGKSFEDYQEWLKSNKEVDLDEFWEQFEEKVSNLENDIIKSLKTKLNSQQQKEVLDFVYNQEKQVEDANQKYIDILQKSFDMLQKKQQS